MTGSRQALLDSLLRLSGRHQLRPPASEADRLRNVTFISLHRGETLRDSRHGSTARIVDSCRKARRNIRRLLRPFKRGATSLPPLALKKSRSKNGFARRATVGSESSICSSDRQVTPDVYAEQLGRVDAEVATEQQSVAALRHDAIDADAAIDYAVGLAAAPGGAMELRFPTGKAAPSAGFLSETPAIRR